MAVFAEPVPLRTKLVAGMETVGGVEEIMPFEMVIETLSGSTAPKAEEVASGSREAANWVVGVVLMAETICCEVATVPI